MGGGEIKKAKKNFNQTQPTRNSPLDSDQQADFATTAASVKEELTLASWLSLHGPQALVLREEPESRMTHAQCLWVTQVESWPRTHGPRPSVPAIDSRFLCSWNCDAEELTVLYCRGSGKAGCPRNPQDFWDLKEYQTIALQEVSPHTRPPLKQL